ncbi:transcriptional regulator [Caproicibacter sp.]|uniref:transcriptional regulator n=1 Tax=Caproicibacter sp. TaxID=2814884 RepID=UPI0039894FE2
MIYTDDNDVKIDGVVLPGLVKSFEIQQDAQIDEEDVEGSTSKPKQATGYEDAKISIEIILDDSPTETKEQKLTKIQNLFKVKSQGIPIIRTIVNQHTAIRNISKILFKSLSSKATNSSGQLSVSIELWEYVPTTITVTKSGASSASKKSANKKSVSSAKSGSASSGGSSGLSSSYQSYLKSDRGTAPKLTNKTALTPAQDTADASKYRGVIKAMPY